MDVSSLSGTSLASLLTPSSTAGGSSSGSGAVGSQLLSALVQSQAATQSQSGTSAQQSVTLTSPTAAQSETPLYNAQGLPTQPASDTSDTAASSQATTGGAVDLNANWAQILKDRPSLAGVVVQSEVDQGVISALA